MPRSRILTVTSIKTIDGCDWLRATPQLPADWGVTLQVTCGSVEVGDEIVVEMKKVPYPFKIVGNERVNLPSHTIKRRSDGKVIG